MRGLEPVEVVAPLGGHAPGIKLPGLIQLVDIFCGMGIESVVFDAAHSLRHDAGWLWKLLACISRAGFVPANLMSEIDLSGNMKKSLSGTLPPWFAHHSGDGRVSLTAGSRIAQSQAEYRPGSVTGPNKDLYLIKCLRQPNAWFGFSLIRRDLKDDAINRTVDVLASPFSKQTVHHLAQGVASRTCRHATPTDSPLNLNEREYTCTW